MKVKEFARVLEETFGDGLYRRIMVIPSQCGVKKIPLGEDNSLGREAIIKQASEIQGKQGRVKQDSSYWKDKAPIIQAAEGVVKWNHSFYLKYAKGLYCIDIDTKAFKNHQLKNWLDESNLYHCETVQGYHYYLRLDLPSYDNELNLANTEHYHSANDLDLICGKRNAWEPDDREILGTTFDPAFTWDDIKHHFITDTMNFKDSPPDSPVPDEPALTLSPQADEEWQVLPQDKAKCDEETMKSYLSRLASWRCDSYDEHIKIGLAILHNFPGDEITAFQVWDEWCQTSDKYQAGGQKKKWQSLKKSECDNPLSYATIKMWADIDDPQNELETLYKESGEDAMVRKMNEKIVFRQEFSDYIHIYKPEDRTYECKKKPEMRNAYETELFKIKVNDKDKVINPFDIWCMNRFREAVNTIDFDPTNQMTDIFNLWNGYAIEEGIESGDSQPLCDHIKRVWCRDNVNHYEYVMDWLAWVLQRPDRKIGVMICVKSRQGTGKGIVVSVMKMIMNGDSHSGPMSQVSNVESILGSWTQGIEGKCLINFDEAYWGGNKSLEGQVKNLITEPTQEIRKKHQKAYFIRNTTAFITTTNTDYFTPITADDRRNFCLDADSDYTDALEDKRAYFRNIVKVPKGFDPHPDVVNDFAHRLYNRDISDFDPEDFEKTALAQEQIQQGWNSTTRWWYRVLEDGIWLSDSIHYGCKWDQAPGDVDAEGYKAVSKRWIFDECYAKTKIHGFHGHHDHYDLFCQRTKGLFREAMPSARRGGLGTQARVYLVSKDIGDLRKAFNLTQKYEVFA
jgi:hypothetical protein